MAQDFMCVLLTVLSERRCNIRDHWHDNTRIVLTPSYWSYFLASSFNSGPMLRVASVDFRSAKELRLLLAALLIPAASGDVVSIELEFELAFATSDLYSWVDITAESLALQALPRQRSNVKVTGMSLAFSASTAESCRDGIALGNRCEPSLPVARPVVVCAGVFMSGTSSFPACPPVVVCSSAGKMTGDNRLISEVVAASAWNVELKKQVFPSLTRPTGLAPRP